MAQSAAGSAGGAAGGTDNACGSAKWASAGPSIPGGVSAGPHDIRQALLAARSGDDPALSRGVELAENDVECRPHLLTLFHRNNAGQAPPIDPRQVYCLFPPGIDDRFDLANPDL